MNVLPGSGHPISAKGRGYTPSAINLQLCTLPRGSKWFPLAEVVYETPLMASLTLSWSRAPHAPPPGLFTNLLAAFSRGEGVADSLEGDSLVKLARGAGTLTC